MTAMPLALSIASERYEIEDEIGQGSSSIVYRGRDRALDRIVALKALRAPDPEELYRLEKEFRALARPSHPTLVELFDLVGHEDGCFFTTELVQGAPIVQALRSRSPLDYGRIRETFRRLAEGVASSTAAASCTPTSSRRTCCSRPRDAPSSWTSALRDTSTR